MLAVSSTLMQQLTSTRSIIVSCQQNVCFNGGSCYILSNSEFICVCQYGYTGDMCQYCMIDLHLLILSFHFISFNFKKKSIIIIMCCFVVLAFVRMFYFERAEWRVFSSRIITVHILPPYSRFFIISKIKTLMK